MVTKPPTPFKAVGPGSTVESGGSTYTVTHFLDAATVLARENESGAVTRLRVDRLQPSPSDAAAEAIANGTDLSEIGDNDWRIAQQRFAAIQPLLDDDFRTRAKATDQADEAGVHVATIYEWLRLYQEHGRLSALIPARRGPKPGRTKLSDEVEAIVEGAITDMYLNKQRHRPSDIIEEVKRQCRHAKVEPPHPNTIRNRIHAIRPATALRKRGRKDQARDLYQPIQGKFPGAETPLSVVQIDHTQADIIVVDEQHRRPIGRPWLTVALDVATRMIFGIHVSLEAPSAASVGLCVANGILQKSEYLASLEVSGDWPVWGKPRVVHVDNAKEFRGKVFSQACSEYGIDLQMRPVKVPHYGGHIERLMGTAANEIRKLPGATFSNIRDRKGYDSSREAALTLREFEQHLVEFIVGVYHARVHSELDMPPKRAWEIGLMGDSTRPGAGLPEIPADSMRIQLDFMPLVSRSVQRYGLQIDGINYYHEVLRPWINEREQGGALTKFTVRRDPRDISTVYFFDPKMQAYFAIPYRDSRHPPISVWELRKAKRTLKAEGKAHQDEDAIFETIERMRARVEDAKKTTKSVRRRSARAAAKPKRDNKRVGSEKSEDGNTIPSAPPPEDISGLFDKEITPFDDD